MAITSPGDVVLVRSGWGRQFDEGPEAYLGRATGVPGVGEAGARWLAARGVLAGGADTIAFERLAAGGGRRCAAGGGSGGIMSGSRHAGKRSSGNGPWPTPSSSSASRTG